MYEFVKKESSVQTPTQIPAAKKQLQNENMNQTGIPIQMKNHYETISGCSLDDVKVHYNSDKPVQLKALAYAQGNQIFMGQGQEKHLGHEIAHVIQQKQGRVTPTKYEAGIPVNTDKQLEQEADSIGMQNYTNDTVQKYTITQSVAQLLKVEDVIPDNMERTEEILNEELQFVLENCEYGELLNTHLNSWLLQDLLQPNLRSLFSAALEEELQAPEMENQVQRFMEYENNVLRRIEGGVHFLCNSIDYWINEIQRGSVNFLKSDREPEIVEIKLTGSDLHDKGIGAAFVTFRLFKKGWIFYSKEDKTVLIKPESRDIEESLLSDREDSLANQYNQSEWDIEDARSGEPVKLDDTSGKISTIKMKVSDEYGTIIERIAGEEIKGTTPINFVSTIKSIVFATMCGLYDLHRDNVLWDEDGELYFIDADNALKTDILNNTLRAQGQSGFPIDFRSRNILIQLLYVDPHIIERTRQAFEGKHGRAVPLSTKYLSNIKRRLWRFPEDFRWNFLLNQYSLKLLEGGTANEIGVPISETTGMDGQIGQRESNVMTRIMQFEVQVGPGLIREVNANPRTFNNELEAQIAYNDFMSGQIPFFEYWYTNGEIKHRGHTICIGKSLNEAFADAFSEE